MAPGMQRVAAAQEAIRRLTKADVKAKKTNKFIQNAISDGIRKSSLPQWKTFAPIKAYSAQKPVQKAPVKKTKKAGRPKGSKNKNKLTPLSPPLPGAKYTDKLRSADRKLGTRRKYYTLPY